MTSPERPRPEDPAPVPKSIARFDPVSTHPAEESERHYSRVHLPWAQQALRERPRVLTYHANRVLRQYDMRGGWEQRPTAWRFVLLTFEAGRSIGFDAATADLVAHDHPNCLRNLRTCPVDEAIRFDRRHDTTVLTKYLVEMDRAPGLPVEEGDRALEEVLGGLLDAVGGAFGARLLRANRVLGEVAAEAVVEPGQRSTGELLDGTDKHAYLELYFDDTTWGDAVFARPEVREILRDPRFSYLEAYHVEERCGLDRRPREDHEAVSPRDPSQHPSDAERDAHTQPG